MIRKYDPLFDYSKYTLYFEDLGNIFNTKITPIDDYSKQISMFKGKSFNLIFSDWQPKRDFFYCKPDDVTLQQEKTDLIVGEITLAIRNKNLKKALKLMKKIQVPNLVTQLNMFLNLKMKRYTNVIEIGNNAMNIVLTDKRCLLYLGKAYAKIGDFGKAFIYLKMIPNVKPRTFEDFETVYYCSAKIYCKRKMFKEAWELINNLTFCKRHRNKVDILNAKIELSIGSKFNGILVALRILSNDMNNLKAMKLIGETICTKEDIEFLFTNIGDSNNNPYILNFFGFILNEHGSLSAARYFYDATLKYLPNDIPVLIEQLKNASSSLIPIDDFLRIATPTIQTISKSKTLKCLTDNLDINNKNEKTIELKPFKLLQQGKESNPFQIEEMDSIWLLIIIETYLFTHGYITQAQIISNNIYNLTSKYDFHESIIEEEIYFNNFLLSLSTTIQRPLPELKKIFVIGNELSISFSWQTLNYNNETNILYPFIIPGIYAKHFSPHKCSQNTELNNVINSIPSGSLVIFALCSIESNIWINSLRGTNKIEYYDDLLQFQIHPLLEKIKLTQQEKQWKIWIHPMYFIQLNEIRTIIKFNEILNDKVLLINKENQNIKLIDTLKNIIDIPNMKYCQEYIQDGFYLSPNYIKLLENSLTMSIE